MRREIVILMVLFSMFLAVGCAGRGETFYVRIQDSVYDTDFITISPGDTVEWTNLDSTNHTVVGTDFSSANIPYQNSYTHTFTKKGTYNYYCSIEPFMKGVVIVK